MLTVTFLGDPPVLAGHSWLTTTSAETLPAPPFLAMPATFPVTDAGDLLAFDQDREIDWGVRDTWSAPLATESQKAHRLFFHIDRDSMALSSGDEVKSYYRLSSMLAQRFQNRGMHHCVRRPDRRRFPVLYDFGLDEDPGVGVPSVGELRMIGERMYSCLRRPEGRELEIEEIQQHFASFACGEATAFHSHGAPNGVNMFCFAELGLLLAQHEKELGLELDAGHAGVFWPAMTWIFAAACEMFVHCFHNGRKRAICAYRPQNNPVMYRDSSGLSTPRVIPARFFDGDEKDEILEEWKSRADDDAAMHAGTFGSFAGKRRRGRVRRALSRLIYSAIHESLEEIYKDVPAKKKRTVTKLDIVPPLKLGGVSL